MKLKTLFSRKTFKSLCTPAQLYFGLSALSILALFIQNCLDPYNLCIGSFSAPSPIHNTVFFMMKVFYIVLWTWIINKSCKSGWTKLAWLIVLFPFISGFVLIGLLIFTLQNQKIKKK